MSTQVVVTLPDNLYRSAERLAVGAQRSVRSVVTEVLMTALAVWDTQDRPINALPDDAVLSLCDSQMVPVQSQRLSELLDKQQAGALIPGERPELWALMRIYELGQLRKAEALAEAVKRNLRAPGRP